MRLVTIALTFFSLLLTSSNANAAPAIPVIAAWVASVGGWAVVGSYAMAAVSFAMAFTMKRPSNSQS